MQSAVSIRALGKKYLIAGQQRSDSVRDLLSNPRELFRSAARQEFWALREVSAEFPEGHIVGVVGKNGAGKSTLLKILSRITDPTEGEVRVYGRIASLLEVGTGFHPELTGRENVFLNGAILGMSRAEIRTKFDEIVAFAEIDRLLDTPVKRYSSGMFVRLAFAVAAHLDPDILLIDEVLSVGDVTFQRKCIGKVESITRQGRTVVIVSHNMGVVTQLCQEVLWLAAGRVVEYGRTGQVISRYLSEGIETNLRWVPRRPASDAFTFHEVRVEAEGAEYDAFPADTPIRFLFDFEVKKPMPATRLSFNILSEYGTPILTSVSTDGKDALNEELPPGRQRAWCVVPGHLLRPGRYVVSISEPDGDGHVIHEGALSFTITEQNSLAARDYRQALITPVLPWGRESEERVASSE